MRRILLVSLICLIAFVMIACFNSNKSIKYNKIYSKQFGFSTKTNSELQSPPEKDIYIFNNEKDWAEFVNTHLKILKISSLDFKNKKVIYLQVDWSEPLSGSSYTISNINVNNIAPELMSLSQVSPNLKVKINLRYLNLYRDNKEVKLVNCGGDILF